jgi:predicted negative regulator of RcsB-dependent stress response
VSIHLSEEEQLENMKRWWKDNGKSVLAAVIVFLAVWFGYEYYKEHTRKTAEAASASYAQLDSLLQENMDKPFSEADKTTAFHIIESLKKDHKSSQYAKSAALVAAKLAVDANDLDRAENELNWALSAKPDAAFEQVVRLRLARVLVAKNELDKALAQLGDKPSAAFESEFQEVRGDIFKHQGKLQEAFDAYELALASVASQEQARTMVLKMKSDDVKTPASSTEEKSQ